MKKLSVLALMLLICVLAATLSACTQYDYFERPEEHDYVKGHEFDEGFGNTNNGYAKDGKEVEMLVKVGDKVLTSKYSGTEVKVDGEECTIVRQSDILAIVEE